MKKKNKKIAFILNTYAEHSLIDRKFNKFSKIYIFNNYLLSENIHKKEIYHDFYDKYKNYEKINQKKNYLCKNWFKSHDFYKKNSKINLVGNLLFSRLHSDFTNKLRIFLSLKKISKSHKHIYFSSKLPVKFKEIQKNFNNCKEFNSSIISPSFLNSIVERSTYRWSPIINKLSKSARLVQSIIPKKKIENKTLVFSSPYVDNFLKKKNDLIFLNRINPYTGYYFNKNVKKNFFFKKKIINKNELIEITTNFIKKEKVNIDKKIVNIFCNCVVENYYKGINYFNWSYDVYEELINYYKPKKIILSSIISFDSLLINFLAKKNNIKTFVCLDGIETVFNPLNILFENNKFIYDKLICYGEADYKLNLKHNISKKQLILGKFPFKINKLNSNKNFDFIIMAFQPRTYNLESRWDKRYLNSIQVIKLLNNLGYKNIAIKIKPDTKNLDPEIKFLQKIIYNNNFSCEILTGNITDYIKKTKNIIGGVSTNIWESASINIPYYIYEPKNMGLLKEQINKSILFREKDVCRNLSDLKKNLINKNYFKPNKKIMFNGINLEKLKF